ncbi:hypothetical protein [Candidatus Poriferisocius sp.]|uniref:hypothetical protein n=1 Tax=Candidatus Poriferisocius sp. TaxID=3101276 RepID=UPI003B022468
MKSIWVVLAATGIAFAGASLLLSGGTLLDSTNGALFPSSDQPVHVSDNRANTGSQSTETLDITSIDRTIRASSDIEVVVGDVQFTIEDHRKVYVEDELWGVSAILRLSKTTSLDGPWITANDNVSMAMYEVDTESIYVAIQPKTGSILTLVPFEAPPNLWGGPVPKIGSE